MRALIGSGVIGGEAMPAWRRFVLRLYAPVLARLGFDPRAGAYAGEAPDRTQRRLQAVGMLATKDRNPALAARLRRAGEAWLAGDRQALDPAWYGPAFAAMLDAGGMEAAKRLVDAALASQDAQFRPVALDAVAASGQADIARWLLEDLRDPRLREQERRGFIAAVIQTGPTQELGYRWLNDNLDGLLAGLGGLLFRRRLPAVLSGFCSAEWADAIARDFGARIAGSGGELALERAIEQVRTCGMLKDLRGGEATRQAKELR